MVGGAYLYSLQVWNASGKMSSAAVGLILPPKQQKHIVNTWAYSKSPKHVIRGAHEADETITCIRFSEDNNTMLSRCMERNGTLAVWDLTGGVTPKKPAAVFEDLPCNYLQTQINWSPDETLFFTGALPPY